MHRRAGHDAAGGQRREPTRAGDQHVGGVHLEHLRRAELGPDVDQARHRLAPVVSLRGNDARGYGAGRSSGNDGKWIARARQQLGQGLQHADLIGARAPPPVSTSPTTGRTRIS